MEKHLNSVYAERMQQTAELDATGLLCPLPVLKIQKRMRALNSGQVLRVTADDPAAAVDIPHFCNEQGHLLLGEDRLDDHRVYLIEKG